MTVSHARRPGHRAGSLTTLTFAIATLLMAPGCVLKQLDAAIDQLRAFNHTFADIERILRNLQVNLDSGVYRNQIEEIVGRTGQVAQLSVMGTVDFVRTRVVEDLERIRAQIKGETPPPRVPYLATVHMPYIDARVPTSRTTVSIVGWNLDIAQTDQAGRYRVEIEKADGTRRAVPSQFVAYAGQYQINVNVSPSGVRLETGDTKLAFRGFSPEFEVPIINSDGIAVRRLRLETNQDRDEKDADIDVHLRFTIGGRVYLDQRVGRGVKWSDHKLTRLELVPSEAAHKPCFVDALRMWGIRGYVERRSEIDEACVHRVVDPRLAELPPLTGTREATLTVQTLEDSSGWGTTFALVGVTDQPPPHDLREVLRTPSQMFNRDGNGSSVTFTFKW